MSGSAPPTPLDAVDGERGRVLKRKVRDRISDVRRHVAALRTAMAEFGEDFDLEEFKASYESTDPVELNKVKAVERGVDQLYNYIADLSMCGLELACIRPRESELNARRDLRSLREAGVITITLEQRLQRLRELRRLLIHEYATATAEQVHESAVLVTSTFGSFYDSYRTWIESGFSSGGGGRIARHDR